MTDGVTPHSLAAVDHRATNEAIHQAVDSELRTTAYGGAFLNRPVFLEDA
ncbi:hypothetical protein [Streptomyces sp. NPDC054765]